MVALNARSAASRRRAERFTGAVLASPAEVAAACELLLLAVPDEALPELVGELSARPGVRPGTLVCHPSGRYGIGVLQPLAAAGALPLALHPAMTFIGVPEEQDRLAGTVFGVTAPVELRAVAEALVIEMGGEPVFVAESDRGLYHAALTWTANYLVTLVAQGRDLLGAAGVSCPSELLGPLLRASLANALRAGDGALSGPLARGDAGTLRAHLAVLEQAAPQMLPGYRSLAALTVARAVAAKLITPAVAASLRAELAGPPGRADEP